MCTTIGNCRKLLVQVGCLLLSCLTLEGWLTTDGRGLVSAPLHPAGGWIKGRVSGCVCVRLGGSHQCAKWLLQTHTEAHTQKAPAPSVFDMGELNDRGRKAKEKASMSGLPPFPSWPHQHQCSIWMDSLKNSFGPGMQSIQTSILWHKWAGYEQFPKYNIRLRLKTISCHCHCNPFILYLCFYLVVYQIM